MSHCLFPLFAIFIWSEALCNFTWKGAIEIHLYYLLTSQKNIFKKLFLFFLKRLTRSRYLFHKCWHCNPWFLMITVYLKHDVQVCCVVEQCCVALLKINYLQMSMMLYFVPLSSHFSDNLTVLLCYLWHPATTFIIAAGVLTTSWFAISFFFFNHLNMNTEQRGGG